MSRSKSVEMQRRAKRAMRDATYLGVDPRDTTPVQGACYANPFGVAKVKALHRAIDKVRKVQRYQPAFTISDAIMGAESDD